MALLGPRAGGRTNNPAFARGGGRAPKSVNAYVGLDASKIEPNAPDKVQQLENSALKGVMLHQKRGEVGTKDSQGRIDHANIVVDAQASPASGAHPLTVNFTGVITGPYGAILWDFNDGGATSTALNPSHAFANAGTYNVVLTAWDYEHDRSFTDTVVVTVS